MNYDLLVKALNLIFHSFYYPFVGYFVFMLISRDYHIYTYLKQKFTFNFNLFYILFKKLNIYNNQELSFINYCNFIYDNKLTKEGFMFLIAYKSYLINVKMFCITCYSLFLIIITFIDNVRFNI